VSLLLDGVPDGAGDTDHVTIGVAIPVPAPFAATLEQWRAEFGDPMATAIPAHITLLPPSVVPVTALATVRDHLKTVADGQAPFDVHLRGTGTFRPVSPVVFVQLAEGVAQCEQLEQQVRSGVLARDLSFYYHPHVTVAHRVDDAALDRAFATLAAFEAQFLVDGFSLYEHGADGVWRVVDLFAFGAGEGGLG
jgi:2'-5' RNA ligase